jgi:uncharacterized protein (DUF4213/DUF364 family)
VRNHPRSTPELLLETLSELGQLNRPYLGVLQVSDLSLRHSFVVARLTDGSQGVAFNYQRCGNGPRISQTELSRLETRYTNSRLTAAELVDALVAPQGCDSLTAWAVAVAIASALSESAITEEVLNLQGLTAEAGMVPLDRLVQPGDTVAMIGWGGYLYQAVRHLGIQRLLVSDLNFAYAYPTSLMLKELASWGDLPRRKRFEVHDGSDNQEMISAADVVCITSSALCNGTMGELLEWAANARNIVVQGHSGAILPKVYFRRRVGSMVVSPMPAGLLHQTRAFQLDSAPSRETFELYLDRVLARKITISERRQGEVRSASGSET